MWNENVMYDNSTLNESIVIINIHNLCNSAISKNNEEEKEEEESRACADLHRRADARGDVKNGVLRPA